MDRKVPFFFSLFFVALLLSYWALLSQDVLLSYDDQNLIYSLKNINGISSYLKAISDGVVFDVQPLRDLSFLLDIKLKKAFTYPFHLNNLLLWFSICFLFYKTMALRIKNQWILLVLTFILMFSPVSSSSVAWVAARKHLLSTLFITSSTYLILKKEHLNIQSKSLITFFYILSLLSQPINALWPIWLGLYYLLKNKIKEHRAWLFILVLLMLAGLLLNYFYYTTVYVQSIGLADKFAGKIFDPTFTLLALGRYFYLVFFPFSSLPASHSFSSLENTIGLILLCLCGAGLYLSKFKNDKVVHLSLVYFLLPLLVVSLRPTNIFCSDTYLLNASMGLYFLAAHFISKLQNKKITFALFLYGVFLFFYNLDYISQFSSDQKLWAYAYEKEPTAQSTMLVALDELKSKDFEKAYIHIDELQKNWPDYPYIPQLMTEGIFFNDRLESDKKIGIVEKFPSKTPGTFFYLAILYAREGKAVAVDDSLTRMLGEPLNLRSELKGKEERVTAIYRYTCDYFRLNECDKRTLELRQQFHKARFDESLYLSQLQHLKSKNQYQVNLFL